MKYLALFLAAGLCACSGNGKTGKNRRDHAADDS